MRKIIGIGETVFDIIFKSNQPIGAFPGGSTFNALISLGRCGIDTTMISETGNDRVGKMTIDFLQQNNVKTDYINIYPQSKSHIALAFLDDKNDADYLFYKDHPNAQLDHSFPEIKPDDIVLFGSYYAINPVIRPQVAGFLEYAKQNRAIIYYDVNFRASHKNEVMRITPNLLDNLGYADVVRGSSEDFKILYNKDSAEAVYRSEISFYCKRFIYTQGANPVQLFAENGFTKTYCVGNNDPVSTVGAGDNFNAGLLFGILQHNITRNMLVNGLTEMQWDAIIATAQRFSAESCKSIFNYISPEFGAEMKAELQAK